MAHFSQNDINRLITSLGRGRANAINAADLALLLGYSAAPNQEELRDLIRQAIRQGELIGSSKVGYWIIDSLNEVEEVLDSLEQRAQGVCERRNALLQSWNNQNPTNVSSQNPITPN